MAEVKQGYSPRIEKARVLHGSYMWMLKSPGVCKDSQLREKLQVPKSLTLKGE